MGFLPAPRHTTNTVGPKLLTNTQSPVKHGEVCGSVLFRLGCGCSCCKRGVQAGAAPLPQLRPGSPPATARPAPSDTNCLYLITISVTGAPVRVNGSILRHDVTTSSESKIPRALCCGVCPCAASGRRQVDGDGEATFVSFRRGNVALAQVAHGKTRDVPERSAGSPGRGVAIGRV